MSTIATRMVFLIEALRRAVAAFAAAQSRPRQVVWLGTRVFAEVPTPSRLPPLPAEIWTLLWFRLGRLANRFEALFDRWRAGTLPRPRPPRPGRTRRPPARIVARLPRSFAWVGYRIREAGPPAGRLIALLAEPEMQAFVQAAPQAGRLLRPLCRAVGVPLPEWLTLPPRPPRKRPAAPPPPRPAPPSAQPATPERPLQPYVRAAARAWKKSGP